MRLESVPGSVLDHKYRVDHQLGRGAMGAVFQATHLGTMRTVALKVIVPKLAGEAEFFQRFKREAEAAGRLHHPNVVNVTDFGVTRFEDGELAYMVMEYLDGETLAAHLKADPRPPFSFILDVADQTALALDAAHAAGIVHRDLKPSNIWLEPNHRGGYNVKVLDFGIAKVSGRAAADPVRAAAVEQEETIVMRATAPGTPDSPEPEASTLISMPSYLRTTVGTLLGTPAYMAPEQCQGAEVDFRADIYSLSTIVYEMLCSRLPFQAEDFKQLVDMQMHQVPQSPHERDSSVPGDLSKVVMTGLAKDPAARPKSAGALAIRLRSVVDGELTPIRRSKDLFHAYTSCFYPLLAASVGFVAACLLPVWILLHTLFTAKAASVPILVSALAVVFFGTVVFAAYLYKAASYLVMKDAAEKGRFQPARRAVLAALLRGLPALLRTQFANLLDWSPRSFYENQLWPVVWAAEGRAGQDALRRSRELCRELSPGALIALAVRHYAPAAIGVTVFPAINALIGGAPVVQLIWREELAGSGVGMFLLFYPLFFMMFYVNYGSVTTFLYWSALGSRGEGGDFTLPASTREDKRSNSRRVRPATVLWVAIPALMLAVTLYKANISDRGDVLQVASDEGRRSAILQALNAGLPADYRLSGGETALFEAVRTGNVKLVDALLARGANVNTKSRGGFTPLSIAVNDGRVDFAALLLDRGADVNAADNDGRTPLMAASMRGNLPMVQLLLAHGADRKPSDRQNKTALLYAQEENNPEIVALLR